MTAHPPTHIPPAIAQQAITTFDAINARGMKHPNKMPSTARQIAVVILGKWDDNNAKLTRMLTNLLITHAYKVEDIRMCDAAHKHFDTPNAKPEDYAVPQ